MLLPIGYDSLLKLYLNTSFFRTGLSGHSSLSHHHEAKVCFTIMKKKKKCPFYSFDNFFSSWKNNSLQKNPKLCWLNSALPLIYTSGSEWFLIHLYDFLYTLVIFIHNSKWVQSHADAIPWGCNTVRMQSRADAIPCGCNAVQMQSRADAIQCGCNPVRVQSRADAIPCGCNPVRV